MTKYATTMGLHLPLARTFIGHASRSGRQWYLIPLIGMIAFGLLYVFVVNQTASQGYQMKELEKKINQLNRETKSLELQTAELQSMGSIGSRVVGMGFVPVDGVSYINASAPAVALK